VNASIVGLTGSTSVASPGGLLEVNQTAQTVQAVILENQNARGVFVASHANTSTTPEPSTVQFSVSRSAGSFGSVSVELGVYQTSAASVAVLDVDFRLVCATF
jgi:hypothetical protein